MNCLRNSPSTSSWLRIASFWDCPLDHYLVKHGTLYCNKNLEDTKPPVKYRSIVNSEKRKCNGSSKTCCTVLEATWICAEVFLLRRWWRPRGSDAHRTLLPLITLTPRLISETFPMMLCDHNASQIPYKENSLYFNFGLPTILQENRSNFYHWILSCNKVV